MKHICPVKTSIISVQKILFYLLCLTPLSALSWRPDLRKLPLIESYDVLIYLLKKSSLTEEQLANMKMTMVINYYWQTTLQMYVFTSFQTLVKSILNQATYQKHHMKHVCSVKTGIISVQKIVFDLLCLTPLSAIFQLLVYHGDQFQWWKKPERTIDHGQALTN